jgi:hypothetical protein
MVRWFPLHRCAVSLHHRLISLLPPGAQTKTDLRDLEKLIPRIRRTPYYASLNKGEDCVHGGGCGKSGVAEGWETLLELVACEGGGGFACRRGGGLQGTQGCLAEARLTLGFITSPFQG